MKILESKMLKRKRIPYSTLHKTQLRAKLPAGPEGVNRDGETTDTTHSCPVGDMTSAVRWTQRLGRDALEKAHVSSCRPPSPPLPHQASPSLCRALRGDRSRDPTGPLPSMGQWEGLLEMPHPTSLHSLHPGGGGPVTTCVSQAHPNQGAGPVACVTRECCCAVN